MEKEGQKLPENYAARLRLLRERSHAMESEDVVIRPFRAMGREGALLYVDGLARSEDMERFILKPLLAASAPEKDIRDHIRMSLLPLASVTVAEDADQVLTRVFSGDAALILSAMPGALIADVKGFAHRAVGQPVNESVVAGPHEGFTESLRDNVVLIRRMLRTPDLISEEITVGDEVPTRLCLMYRRSVIQRDTVDEVRRRLRLIRVDYVSSLGMLEQLMEDHPFSLLPQAAATERPDRAVSFLNEGQAVIVMENAPQVLALPAGFWHLFHAPDDTALRWQYGAFLRFLRLIGMGLALLLPGVFLALTVFHPEGMSLSLLTSVVESQARVPLTLFASLLLMLFIFSLINEAASRVPGAMGASLSIVSGLILGQAAVEADLFSPLILIVVALSGLGSYTAPTHALTLALRICQLALVLGAGLGGYLSMIPMLFVFLLRLMNLTSLGFPYFAPIAPKRIANPDTLLRLPVWTRRTRGPLARETPSPGPMRGWEKPKEEK